MKRDIACTRKSTKAWKPHRELQTYNQRLLTDDHALPQTSDRKEQYKGATRNEKGNHTAHSSHK